MFHFEDWRFTLLVKGALMLVMDLMTAQGGEVGAESAATTELQFRRMR